VRLSALGMSPTIWPTVPAPDDKDDECGVVGGMNGKGNRSTRINPAPVSLVHHKSHMTSHGLEPGTPRR
jgi:hypothetical protein